MKKRISVRNLVEFILRSGNIDSGFTGRNRLEEGARVHRKLQKAEGYQAEVHLSITETHDGIDFTVEGRADGVIITESGVTLDEIKSTLTPLELIDEDFSQSHWAQAMCYGHMYCVKNELDKIDVRLTYYEMETGGIKRFVRPLEASELEAFFAELLAKYAIWAHFESQWKETAKASMLALQFPFGSYRDGQRKLAAAVYRTITAKGRLFAMAPTGIGKTISTLFPAIKAMGEGSGEKIFYLTARTITRLAASSALNLMRKPGLRVKSVTITAKDKICPLEERICKPSHCECADGHFDRINDAIMDTLKNCDDMSASEIAEYAQRHKVCPFELSLDLALWSDIIICDYNYAFDPQVSLKRFFSDSGGDYVFLIDEAHNMVGRAREMYSASISKRGLLAAKKALEIMPAHHSEGQGGAALHSPDPSAKKRKKNTHPCIKTLTKINKLFIEKRKECEDVRVKAEKEPPLELNALLEIFAFEFSKWLSGNPDPDGELLQVYFDVLSYLNIADLYDGRYTMLYEAGAQGELTVKQFCADPSHHLGERFDSGRAAILFSATLTPAKYFIDVLGGGENSKYISLPSPFPREKMLLLIADNISTKYKDREESYEQIVGLIYQTALGKTGNYIAYFPSYKYLFEVYSVFQEKYPEIHTVTQTVAMAENERDGFLALFEENSETMVAFCVLGGIFAEGIDLIGDRLIGTVIVGVGLPMINSELDTVRDYYAEALNGYDFAYRYPGMNKVLQAAGRVIRSGTDKGVILLIDSRFATKQYTDLYPNHWKNYQITRNSAELKEALNKFWKH